MNEIWKDVNGYEGIYQVSNFGNVKSLAGKDPNSIKKEKILKPGKNSKRNLLVSLWKNAENQMKDVKRLVWETFVENIDRNKLIINIDGNIRNCRLDNLQLITARQHSAYNGKIRHKTSKYTGVSITKGARWRAQININGKVKHLGYRDTEEEAADLYNQALSKL